MASDGATSARTTRHVSNMSDCCRRPASIRATDGTRAAPLPLVIVSGDFFNKEIRRGNEMDPAKPGDDTCSNAITWQVVGRALER